MSRTRIVCMLHVQGFLSPAISHALTMPKARVLEGNDDCIRTEHWTLTASDVTIAAFLLSPSASSQSYQATKEAGGAIAHVDQQIMQSRRQHVELRCHDAV